MVGHNGFETLLSPVKIGMVEIKNRVMMAPMSFAGIANSDGSPSDYYIGFLEERAKGGVGLIVTGETVVDNDHRMISLAFHSRRMVPTFARLVEAVKAHEAKIFLQIAHPGGVCVRSMTGRQPVAPTAMMGVRYTEMPRALTKGEIQAVIDKYVGAAFWGLEAGFDGIEMHAAHGFDLIGQFLSPYTNKREDEYGASLEGRLRFVKEIVEGVKERCGGDFPIGLKYNGYEALEGGIDLPMAVRIGQYMEDVGVDYVHVACMSCLIDEGYRYPSVSSMYSASGALIELAREVKRNLRSIPVVGTGGINKPDLAEDILKKGEVDLLALGRTLIADPTWVERLRRREASSIVPCIRCNVCHRRLFQNHLTRCTVNPFLGWAGKQDTITTARKRRKIAVVGGGPAGVQAALVTAERGHEVTLYERKTEIGGNLIPASVPDFKDDLKLLLRYYRDALSRSSVHVRLGVIVSPKTIGDGGFDAVILALGGEPIIPDVPGIDRDTVVTAAEILDAKRAQQMGRQVIVLGAGHVGCETAWYLGQAGKSVKVFDIIGKEEILADDHHTNRSTLLINLELQGIEILGKRVLREVGKGKVSFEGEGGRIESYPADHLVLAVGYRAMKGLREALGGLVPDHEIYEVGDCAQPGRLFEAIHSAKDTAEKL